MAGPSSENNSYLPSTNSVPKRPTHDSFAVLMFISNLEGAASFRIAPGYELRRATLNEITIIRRILGVTKGLAFYTNPFETDRGSRGTRTPLPKTEWRYFVIAFAGSQYPIWEINWTFCLAEVTARVTFIVDREDSVKPTEFGEWSYQQDQLFRMSSEFETGSLDFREFTRTDLEKVISLLAKLRSHDENIFPIKEILQQILALEKLPSGPLSGSEFLGHFAILESMLTHQPKPTDPYESITRQIKSKLRLLDNRWVTRLNYESFGNCTSATLWSKMYAYRSCLAHGARPDFDGELKILVKPQAASDLLKRTVKAVARQCLLEPRLLADLRDC